MCSGVARLSGISQPRGILISMALPLLRCYHRLPLRQIPNPDVFEPHVPMPTRLQLERDAAIRALRLGIGEVDHLHAIQPRNVAVPDHHHQVLVPVVWTNHGFVLRRRPHDPMAMDVVNARGVVVDAAVNLELRSLSRVRGAGLELDVKEYAAVAVALAFVPERQLEVDVVFLRAQIAVLLRNGKTMDGAITKEYGYLRTQKN